MESVTRDRAAALDLDRLLNPEQAAAATHGEGPQLVIAGAGTGKTRVITYRIAWLVEERGVDPGAIAAVTFTNKAAAEMRERVEELLGMYPLPTFVGTFHRFSLGLLRRYGERVGVRRNFAILDTNDQLQLVKQAILAEGLDERSYTPRAVLSAISSAKNRLLTPEDYAAEADNFYSRKVVTPVYRRYQGLLHHASGVDFDDMISYAVRLLTEETGVGERVRERLDYLLVDEYQDTNHAQLQLILALTGPDGNLTAVGDEDQGIYRWRGAEIENILSFEKTFPGAVVRKLERNYRSTQNILDASGKLIAHNEKRRGKELWTEAGGGDQVELYRAGDEGDEARWIVGSLLALRGQYELSDMAVLVRTNAQTRALEEQLLRREVPYVLVGGTRFYERAEIKDLIAYLRVLRNPRDTFSLERVINQPPRGIGKGTQEILRQIAMEKGQPTWDVLANDELGEMPSRGGAALRSFAALIKDLQAAAEELPLPALLDRLLEQTGYAAMFEKKGDPESEARLENIREFLSAAQEFTEESAYRGDGDDDLTAFLDHVSLVADVDSWQSDRGVSVMTLHSAKGLEFSVVVVGGLEDGLLPHFNSQGARDDLEEERRLLYVGMTRAKRRLLLSCCRRRRIAGRYQDQLESPFLSELPGELLSVTESPSLFQYPRSSDHRGGGGHAGGRSGAVYSFFGQPDGGGSGGGSAGGGRPNAARAAGAAEPPPWQSPATPNVRGIRRGSRVAHPVLGNGVVLATEGGGDQEKITVYFERAGKKKLLAKYANLELL